MLVISGADSASNEPSGKSNYSDSFSFEVGMIFSYDQGSGSYAPPAYASFTLGINGDSKTTGSFGALVTSGQISSDSVSKLISPNQATADSPLFMQVPNSSTTVKASFPTNSPTISGVALNWVYKGVDQSGYPVYIGVVPLQSAEEDMKGSIIVNLSPDGTSCNSITDIFAGVQHWSVWK